MLAFSHLIELWKWINSYSAQKNLDLLFSFSGEVVGISIVVLIALFSIQRFGTGKVGFLFAPILALWFFSLGSIGLYNIIKYDITVLRAFNPAYIYFFFKRNSKAAWSSLGGCVLCITGNILFVISMTSSCRYWNWLP